MDLLIYNMDHWMDDSNAYVKAHLRIESDTSLTPSQILKSKGVLTDKYNARYQRGDVVEVGPDGRYANQTNPKFKVVHLPGVKNLGYLTEAEMDGQKMVKRRRYAVDTGLADKASFPNVADLSITDKVVSIG